MPISPGRSPTADLRSDRGLDRRLVLILALGAAMAGLIALLWIVDPDHASAPVPMSDTAR